MSETLTLVTFLCVTVVLTVVARRLRIPYPIAFVIGGVILAFSRHLPRPHFDPELVLVLVLPPLLYGAAWTTDWIALRRNWAPVSLFAVGLPIFTMLVVGVFLHAFARGFTWPLAFTLGAIVSPPDAVASEAIFERLAVPARVAAIINGECLLNDATALVVYRFALAALITGAFSLASAGLSFVIVAAGGIAIGFLAAIAIELVFRYINRAGLDDPAVASVLFLIAPFAAYLPAEAAHVSGVLGAVTAGIVLSRRSPKFIDSESRVLGSAVWRLLIFILNAFAFLLIGLQLPVIAAELYPHVLRFAVYGLELSALVILVRFVWVVPSIYLPRLLSKRLHSMEALPSWRNVLVLAWSGMRGIVSLATALALPYTLGAEPFPLRSVTIFLSFCVVFVTLVGQGLTLGPLIGWLGISEASRANRREAQLRIRALEAGLARLEEIQRDDPSRAEQEVLGRIFDEYHQRIAVLRGRADGGREEADDVVADRHVQKEALAAERREIAEMRRAGEIPDDIYRTIEYDLDLAAIRLS